MRDIHVIEHRDLPVPDRGQRHLVAKGFNLRFFAPYRGESLPELDGNTAGVMIMGGPQYVTRRDDFPALATEMDFAGRTMAKGIPLLGIYLGAQIIAGLLGARIAFHPEDHLAFGYYELFPTAAGRGFLPAGLHAPAGNAQGFELPDAAVLLARGRLFPNQAFRVGATTYGLQFHPEVTRPILDDWHSLLADNFGKPGTQDIGRQNEGFRRHDSVLHDWYTGFLDRFFQAPET